MKKIFWLALIIVLAGISFVAFRMTKSTNTLPDIELVEHNCCETNGDYCKAVCGIIRNNTDTTKSNLRIYIDGYDNNGTQLTRHTEDYYALAPHDTWEFKANLKPDDITRYEIIDLHWAE